MLLDYSWTDELFSDVDNGRGANGQFLNRDSVDMLHMSATHQFPNDKFEISVGGTHILDERYPVSGQNRGGIAVVDVNYSEPAQWYATFRAKY